VSPDRSLLPAAAVPRLRPALSGLVAALLLLSAAPAAAAGAPPSGGSVAARDLRAQVERGDPSGRELARFYAGRGWQPLWLAGDGLAPAGEELLALVRTAEIDGLSRKALKLADLETAVRKAGQEPGSRNLARAEALLSRGFVAYVRAMRSAQGSGMSYQLGELAPTVPSAAAILETAAAAASLRDHVRSLGWMHPLYGALRTALAAADLAPAQQRQVRSNLERLRALPTEPAPRYVLIDAAGARLWMYERGKPVDSMKVVVGKPDQQTPMVAGLITEAVLNPYWNVPVDLARSRIAPNVLGEGLRYLRQGGYQVLSDFTDQARLVDPGEVAWREVADGRREVRVRQLPGKSNFMGIVKFDFRNPDGVFLHDTPEKALLKAEVRTASAGCVRLEDAARLGRWLFGRPLVARSRAAEQAVPLSEPVPKIGRAHV